METRLDSIERCWREDGCLDGRLVESLLRVARAAERLPPHCFSVCKALELTGVACTCGMDALRRALEGTPAEEK